LPTVQLCQDGDLHGAYITFEHTLGEPIDGSPDLYFRCPAHQADSYLLLDRVETLRFLSCWASLRELDRWGHAVHTVVIKYCEELPEHFVNWARTKAQGDWPLKRTQLHSCEDELVKEVENLEEEGIFGEVQRFK
jgi:hypothetical protein